MKKWEYKIVRAGCSADESSQSFSDELSKLGSEGWRVKHCYLTPYLTVLMERKTLEPSSETSFSAKALEAFNLACAQMGWTTSEGLRHLTRQFGLPALIDTPTNALG